MQHKRSASNESLDTEDSDHFRESAALDAVTSLLHTIDPALAAEETEASQAMDADRFSDSAEPSDKRDSSSDRILDSNEENFHPRVEEDDPPRPAKYGVGLVLLLAVIFLWVGSGELIQYIYHGYDHPFLLTYFNTSLFSVYLVTAWIQQQFCHNGALNGHTVLQEEETDNEPLRAAAADSEVALSNGSISVVTTRGAPRKVTVASDEFPDTAPPSRVWTLRETAPLAAILCPLWFGLNYTYNYSLSRTSLASNTILSTTSGLWTMFLSRWLLQEGIRWSNALGVVFTLTGGVLVGLSDSKDTGGKETAWGDFWCLMSAIVYATYTVTLKLKVPDESRLNTQYLFGLLGVFNILWLWPMFFILHYSGIERFSFPNGETVGYMLLNGMLGTVVADLAWAKSVLYTSPLIATLGLSLTIPLAMVTDVTINGKSFTVLYFMGSVSVVCGFVLVNWRFKSPSTELRVEDDECHVEREAVLPQVQWDSRESTRYSTGRPTPAPRPQT